MVTTTDNKIILSYHYSNNNNDVNNSKKRSIFSSITFVQNFLYCDYILPNLTVIFYLNAKKNKTYKNKGKIRKVILSVAIASSH